MRCVQQRAGVLLSANVDLVDQRLSIVLGCVRSTAIRGVGATADEPVAMACGRCRDRNERHRRLAEVPIRGTYGMSRNDTAELDGQGGAPMTDCGARWSIV